MALLLFLAFVAVPIIEITVIIKVGGLIGAWQTVGLIILTAAVGSALVRAQGFQILARAQQSLDQGEFPAAALVDGLALLVAGVLLLTPGFVTDFMGIALLIPPLRRLIAGWVLRRMLLRGDMHIHAGFTAARTHSPDDDVIEGEFREIPPDEISDRRDPPRR
jgi:UPF0716 protein FxsA